MVWNERRPETYTGSDGREYEDGEARAENESGKPVLSLIGEDGNAFVILGRASKALRRAGPRPPDRDEVVRGRVMAANPVSLEQVSGGLDDRSKTPEEALRACLRRAPRPGDAELMLAELRDRYGYQLVRISPDHPSYPDKQKRRDGHA